MKCKQVYHFICDNLDADIDSPQCRQIKKHLGACPNCSAYLDSLKKTVFLYRTQPSPAVPTRVHKDLLRAIDLALNVASPDRNRGPKHRSH